MLKRMIAPVLFGLIGASILVSLGLWQSQRLVWKQGIIAEINAKIAKNPVALPQNPTEAKDEYLAVKLNGAALPGEIHVLTSHQIFGPGYRLITRFQTGDRVILVDRGFVQQKSIDLARPQLKGEIIGNLLWPNELDPTFTPKPDLAANIWFARDLPAMAKFLKAEPILVVLRSNPGGVAKVLPWPVTSSGIPNNHLEYAVTWFLMALAWLGMTAYWVWRIRRQLD
ncbi:MAG: SURF1 family protein [Alphaproteobacteria bacterium]|nr:SURF1 family protein [Alphaproteobacteria bacterium]